jgi:hypothetical protein
MSSRQYPRVLLTSFLIVGLTGRASIAFNIIPPTPGATRYYKPVSTYRIDNDREGRTEIDMRLWSQPLPRGGTPTFKRVLSLSIVRTVFSSPSETLDFPLVANLPWSLETLILRLAIKNCPKY